MRIIELAELIAKISRQFSGFFNDYYKTIKEMERSLAAIEKMMKEMEDNGAMGTCDCRTRKQ